jgi:hypothetical protein
MAVQWDYTLVKAFDEKFTHVFPNVLVGCIFRAFKERYGRREFVHVITKSKSVSYSMDGLNYCYVTEWGDGFAPNHAKPSRMFRECLENSSAWIDTESQILYYTPTRNHRDEFVFKGISNIFAGSNPIPLMARCSHERFINFVMGIRENYIKIACNSATVCLVDNEEILSTHKVYFAVIPIDLVCTLTLTFIDLVCTLTLTFIDCTRRRF